MPHIEVKEILILLALAKALALGPQWTVEHLAPSYGINPVQAACIVQNESLWNPELVGKAGEKGLFQIMPETAEWAAGKLGMATYNLFDPLDNIRMGLFILSQYPEWYSTLYLCD